MQAKIKKKTPVEEKRCQSNDVMEMYPMKSAINEVIVSEIVLNVWLHLSR
jgi:hypothetical protein